MPMIIPAAATINQILQSANQYVIPAYQRDYTWGKAEASDLLEDLAGFSAQDASPLYLGTVILQTDASGVSKSTSVIDGQQRLTTLLLLLIACRMRAAELNLSGVVNATQRKITWMDPNTDEARGCRLTASVSIRNVFNYIAHPSWNGVFPDELHGKSVRNQSKKLSAPYKCFQSNVSDMNSEMLSKFIAAVGDAYVIAVSIEKKEEALQIFERTNARGKELEATDLLKNFLFSMDVDGLEHKWKEIQDNSDGNILRLVKYFYVSKNGYILKADLYRALKHLADQLGANSMTDELLEFSRFFYLTRKPTKERVGAYFHRRKITSISGNQEIAGHVVFSLQALRAFGVVQYIPLVYSAIEMLRKIDPKKAASANQLQRLILSLEKYHFVNNAICDRVGNDVERLYADECTRFNAATDLKDTFDKFISQLIAKLADENEFKSRFVSLQYPPRKNRALMTYIFDRFVNFGSGPGAWLPIFVLDPRLRTKNVHLEHYMPQVLPQKSGVSEATKDAIPNIGNLLPLYSAANIALSNEMPMRKKELLENDYKNEIKNNGFVQVFLRAYSAQIENWDDIAIQQRANDLAVEAYTKVWKLF